MRSIQTQHTFPLELVKPLEGLMSYRAYCVEATRRALRGTVHHRQQSPVSGARLKEVGAVEGLAYARCPDSGSLFLAVLPDASAWGRLVAEVTHYRHSPGTVHAELTRSRADNVYAPKLEWIRDTLRLQGVERPSLLEVGTSPSDFTGLLRQSGVCATVTMADEMELAHAQAHQPVQPAVRAEAAVLLESLDRVDDPVALLEAVAQRLAPEGLVFVTALVASGFDLSVLGLRNLYLYPPDRANCFSLQGLSQLLEQHGFTLLEVSTPGVLDVEIVRAHLEHDPALPLSPFERQLLNADGDTHKAFQSFLQQQGLSSFARLVGRKRS